MKTKHTLFLASFFRHESPGSAGVPPASLVSGSGRRDAGAPRCFVVCLGLAALAASVIGAVTHQRGRLVAHEWGTFTSVQGGDGVLLDWRPLETSRLPGFVYD